MSLESVDDIEGGDGFPLGVLSVCDSVADDTFKEGLQDTSGFFVDHGGDTLIDSQLVKVRRRGDKKIDRRAGYAYLDTTSASETSDSWLGDTLDVVSQDLAMALRTTLAETLATFATSSHVVDEELV